MEGVWPGSRGEGEQGGAEGGSPLDGVREVFHQMMEVAVAVVAPPGGPASPAVGGFGVKLVVGAVSGTRRCAVDTPPSAVVVSPVGGRVPEDDDVVMPLEASEAVEGMDQVLPAGPSEDCSGSPKALPAPVFEVVIVAAVVDLPLVPPTVTSSGLAEVLPPAMVALVLVVSSDWPRPRLDVEFGTGSGAVEAEDSVVVHVASD